LAQAWLEQRLLEASLPIEGASTPGGAHGMEDGGERPSSTKKGSSSKKVGHRGGAKRTDEDFNILERDELGGDEAKAADSAGEEGEEEVRKAKQPAVVLERDDDLERELAAQFADNGLTSKQRKELAEQEEKRKAEKDQREGRTEESKADLERLQELRRKREEAAAKKKEDESKAKEKAKEATKDKAAAATGKKDAGREVAVAIVELIGKKGPLTINQLAQDADCKKVLKPLCKKHDVKKLDRQFLEKFADILDTKDEGTNILITGK